MSALSARQRALVAVVVVVLAAFAFQAFLRYGYVAAGGGFVLRVDRLTGQSCYVGTTC